MTLVADMTDDAHVCAVPVSDEQLWEVSAQFLAEGLAGAERVVYFDDDGAADAVLDRLVDDRVPVQEPLATGQLTVVPAEETRRLLRRHPEEVRRLVAQTVDETLAAGWFGLRVTGQFSYGLRRPAGVALWEYDLALDAALRECPSAKLLCLYDRRRFPEAAIEEMRALHRRELSAPALYDDGLLRITRIGSCRARLAGEVDHSNRPRIGKLLDALLDESLRGHDGPSSVELNLASLRFLDVAAAVALVHGSERFPSTHRLVLSGVRPGVMRVLDRCGAPFAAQLVVEPHPGFTDTAHRGAA